MKALSTVFFLIFATTVLSACVNSPTTEEPPTPAVMEETQAEPAMGESAPASSGVVVDGKIAISADNFKYDVTEIKVKVGEPLTMAVTNAEGFHDLLIDELEVNSGMIPAGETKELIIPTDKPGTYEFYCSVGEHRAMGMKGTLIIE